MLNEVQENYILNRRFVRACEIIMADETIPKNEFQPEVQGVTKYSKDGDYRVTKNLTPVEGNADTLRVDTRGYGFMRMHNNDRDTDWVYMFDNDKVSSPWLHGFKIPTSCVPYLDVRPTRRLSAGRYHLENAVNIMEDDILRKMSAKPLEKLTDEEILTELHLLIGNIIGVESSFYPSNYDGFAIHHQEIECLEGPFNEAEAHRYLLLSDHCRSLEVLSKKNEVKIITKMNDDYTYDVADTITEFYLREKVLGYLCLLRNFKRVNDKHFIAIENAFTNKPKEKIKVD